MNSDLIEKIGGIDNFRCVIESLEIIKESVQHVYTAEILKDKNTTCPQCQYDFLMRVMEKRSIASNIYEDLTKYAFVALTYDLLESRANCTRLAALMLNLLSFNCNFRHKSKLEMMSNNSIDHCVLIYKNLSLNESVVIDPFSIYYNYNYVLNTFENFILKTQNDVNFKSKIEDWNTSKFCFHAFKNIPVPILQRKDEIIEFSQAAKDYHSTINIDFEEIQKLAKIQIEAKIRADNKKGPHK